MDPSVYIDQDNKNIQTGAERSVPNQFPETLP